MPVLETAKGNLYYEVIDLVPPWAAKRDPILFHHGISTTSAIWSDWLPVLADRHRIVRFDMRGFGRSSVPPPDMKWSFDGLVDDVTAVADRAGAERFHFVGESIGGTVGLATALRHPARLASLTVSNGAHRGTAVQNIRGRWEKKIAAEGQEAWARQMMEWRFFPGGVTPKKHRWFLDQHATCSLPAALGLAELLLATDLSDEVAAIGTPTLLLSPDSSPFIPVQLMCDLHARLRDAELRVFPHSRHGLPLSHGRECAQTLREFLDRRFED
jgi:pimeloyl-ACP methyl ester carboxylesterase